MESDIKKDIQEQVEEKNPKRTEKSDSAPVHNNVVALVTMFFWPIAWWLLAYVSLKNLWEKKAIYVFPISIVVTIILSYVLMVPLAHVEVQWVFIQAPMALIFILFQHKAVQQWALNNPTVKYRNSPKDIGWVLLWFILYFVVWIAVAIFVTPV